MSDGQTEEAFLGPIGEAPCVSIRLQPAPGHASIVRKGIIIAELSTNAPTGDLGKAICEYWNLPPDSLLLMYKGETLNPLKSLVENSITLPGAAARRKGTKLEIFFDANKDVLDRESQREQAEIWKLQQEEALRLQEEKKKQREKEKMVKLQHDLEHADIELDEYAQTMGISQTIRDRLRMEAESGIDVAVPPNFLTPCSAEQVQALQQLMQDTGVTTEVYRAYQNKHDVLLRRYKHAKTLLIQGGMIQNTSPSTTKQHMPVMLQQDFLGDYGATVNELLMWHGTPNSNAASSICSSGFDIAFAGKHGTAWGHGFYFADEAKISHQYVKTGHFVNNKYRSVGVMLLCRVLCGNVKHISSPPTMEQKERFTAECLGPGGTFGAKSDYHSICGSNWAYVCAHRDQVYPAYVILYRV